MSEEFLPVVPTNPRKFARLADLCKEMLESIDENRVYKVGDLAEVFLEGWKRRYEGIISKGGV